MNGFESVFFQLIESRERAKVVSVSNPEYSSAGGLDALIPIIFIGVFVFLVVAVVVIVVLLKKNSNKSNMQVGAPTGAPMNGQYPMQQGMQSNATASPQGGVPVSGPDGEVPTDTPAMVFCTQCGARIPATAAFCSKCGSPRKLV